MDDDDDDAVIPAFVVVVVVVVVAAEDIVVVDVVVNCFCICKIMSCILAISASFCLSIFSLDAVLVLIRA